MAGGVTGPGENNEAERAEPMADAAEAPWPYWKIGADIISGGAEEILGTIVEDPSTVEYLSALVAERDRLAAQVETLREALDGLAFRILEDGSCFCWFNPHDDIHATDCKRARDALAALRSAGVCPECDGRGEVAATPGRPEDGPMPCGSCQGSAAAPGDTE